MKNSLTTETHRAHGANWAKWLSHLIGKQDVAGMEIGTFKGESAEWMLENVFTNTASVYYCVDPFTGNVEHKVGNIDCSTLEQETRNRLERFPQAKIIKGFSKDFLKGEDARFDFIYVDGAHDAMNVLRDSVLAFEILKPGGILVWDDFEWVVMGADIDRPKIAIHAFLQCYQRQLKTLHVGWQVAIQKI